MRWCLQQGSPVSLALPRAPQADGLRRLRRWCPPPTILCRAGRGRKASDAACQSFRPRSAHSREHDAPRLGRGKIRRLDSFARLSGSPRRESPTQPPFVGLRRGFSPGRRPIVGGGGAFGPQGGFPIVGSSPPLLTPCFCILLVIERARGHEIVSRHCPPCQPIFRVVNSWHT